MTRGAVLLGILFAVTAITFVSPNPYGNSPDVLGDESYFLTSSLEAMRKGTLPGWEFSTSGAYYGGIQAYLDFFALVPVVAAVFAYSGFSALEAQVLVALNTGELLHVLRLVNGMLSLAALAWGVWYFAKRSNRALGLTLVFFTLLTLGNAFVVPFLHTAKVWPLWIALTSIVSAFFIAQSHYAREGRVLLSRPAYAGIFVWGMALAFFQAWVGVFSVAIIALYALALKQLSVRDYWEYFKKRWYWFAALAATQVAFVYRAYFINWLSGSFSEISPLSAERGVEWAPRLLNPLKFTWEGAPLTVVLWVLGIVALLFVWRRFRQEERPYAIVALLHAPLTYTVFHVAIGFGGFFRYGLFLALALALSSAMLWGLVHAYFGHLRALQVGITAAAALVLAIFTQSIFLHWKPASEAELMRIIEQRYNADNQVFIAEPDALRLTLPVNAESFMHLGDKRGSMARFAFLRKYPDLVRARLSWQPITLIAYSEKELADARTHFPDEKYIVWSISTNCRRLCEPEEGASCFVVHADACRAYAGDVVPLFQYLRATQLGSAYVVRRAD